MQQMAAASSVVLYAAYGDSHQELYLSEESQAACLKNQNKSLSSLDLTSTAYAGS